MGRWRQLCINEAMRLCIETNHTANVVKEKEVEKEKDAFMPFFDAKCVLFLLPQKITFQLLLPDEFRGEFQLVTLETYE